jgi:hypothetical protein
VSSRRYQSHGPWSHEPCSTEEDHNVCVDYNGTLKQLFRVAPGEPYRLSFSVDETTLPEDASFTVAMAFYDESFEQLGFRHPVKGVEVDEIQEYNIGSFPPDTAARHELRFRAIDCDEHLMYEAGTAISTEDVYFNFCLDYGEESVHYAAIDFVVVDRESEERTAYVKLDDVVIERERAIEIEILRELGSGDDSDGAAGEELLQSSTLTSGFFAELSPTIASDDEIVLRVRLRSLIEGASPVVTRLSLPRALPLQVVTKSPVACFDQPRLGFTGRIPPRAEWNDATREQMRTLCVDPFEDALTEFEGEAPLCTDLLVASGVSRWRSSISKQYLSELEWSPDVGMSFELEPPAWEDGGMNDLTHSDGETELRRYAELRDAGFEILGIANPKDLESFCDPLPAGVSSRRDCLLGVSRDYISAYVDMFDGETSIDLDGTEVAESVVPPRIDRWQILVEHNLDRYRWYHTDPFDPYDGNPFGGDDSTVLNELASAVLGTIEDEIALGVRSADDPVTVATSMNPHDECYDWDYIEMLWRGSTIPDPTLFTHLGVNTFIRDCTPEGFSTDLPRLDELVDRPWSDALLSVGAYNARKTLFDPARGDYDEEWNGDWERGYGEFLYAKRTARQTLVNLSLPAEDIYWYNPFDMDGWKGSNLHHDPTWRLNSWASLFERRLGTEIGRGILGDTHDDLTAGADEASVYEANSAGIAFLTIARYLSNSSPVGSHAFRLPELVRGPGPPDALSGEAYHTGFYQDHEGNWVLALWFFRDYEHGSGEKGEELNHFDGLMDHGFEERRLHDVLVAGSDAIDLTSVARAEVIRLDGSRPQPSAMRRIGSGRLLLRNVVVGEEPVLIRLIRDGESASPCERTS